MNTLIGTYTDVSILLKLSKSTIYRMTSNHQLPKGVYLGHGRFNLHKLHEHIEAGTLFQNSQKNAIQKPPIRSAHKKNNPSSKVDYKAQIREEVKKVLNEKYLTDL